MKWWQKTIAYELYPKSFHDTTGNGSGDLRGIIDKLDYLASLHIGALWLTPVCVSPMVDNGYDIADYCAIDARYGTLDDMKTLIAEAKKRGIRIIIDLVFNHTSNMHPWFLASKTSRDNEKSDWYIWRDEKPGHLPPTNWRGIFGGSAWTWCEERRQYYLHTFASAQPDLNWSNPEVRQALYDAANFWLDLGAGGFRVDAITYIKKPEVLADGIADGEDGMVSVHDMTANTPGILDYLQEFKKNVSEGHDIFTVAEANGVAPDELKYWVGEHGAFDMLFEFSHVNLEFKGVETWCKPDPWTLIDLKNALSASQEATKTNGWYPIFFENHDKPRSIDHYFAPDANKHLAAKLIAVITLTLRGTPFIYQGQELGYGNVAYPHIDDYDDISTHGQYAFALEEGFSQEEALACVHRFSRDNARTPMQWNDRDHAGFSTGTPWLAVHPEYKTENVAYEDQDPDSVLNWYRTLIKLRLSSDDLMTGDYQEVLHDHSAVYAYRRGDMLIMTNFTSQEAVYPSSITSGMDVLLSSVSHQAGILKPLEAVIFKKADPER